MDSQATYFQKILKVYRKREAGARLKHLLWEFLSVNTGYFLFVLFLESLWYLSPGIKHVLWAFLCLNAYYIFRLITIILGLAGRHTQEEDEALFLLIGQGDDRINDKLLNHYQLSKCEQELSHAAVALFITAYPPEYFEPFMIFPPIARKRRIALFMMGAALIISFCLGHAVTRLAHPSRMFEPECPYWVIISPGDTSLYAYDTLTISIRKNAPPHFPVELYRINNETHTEELIERSRDSLISYSSGRITSSEVYIARLRRISIFQPRKYLASDTISVEVLQRPRIRSMEFVLTSPAYSEIPPVVYQGNIDRLSCLYGTEITLTILLSEAAGPSAAVTEQDTLPMGREENTLRMIWIPVHDGEIQLLLNNLENISVEPPPTYQLELQTDEFPMMEVVTPDVSDEQLLDETLQLPYVIHCQDDYGLSNFSVHYTVYSEYSTDNDTSYKIIDLAFDPSQRLQTCAGVWEIDAFVSPGSDVRYYFELTDNDVISGPKAIRSILYDAKFPSLGDLYARQQGAQDETRTSLEEDMSSTGEIVRELDEIQKELLREGEMNWEKKTALEENLNALEEIRKDLETMETDISEQQRFMEENSLFSESVMNSFEQLQDLLNELIDDELFELMQEIKEKMDQPDMPDMESIMENFTEKAKQFEQSLDRMLSVLKRIQQEQRLEEIGRQIKESLKNQSDLLDHVDDRSQGQLADQQEKIADDTKKWEELSRESAPLFDEDNNGLQEFLQKMNERDVSSTMEQASSRMRNNQKEQGMQKSAEASQKLQSLDQMFSQMASTMMQQQKDDVLREFQQAFHQSLYMSNLQEKEREIASEINDNSPLIHAYTSREYDILELALALNKRLMELSKKTFFVDRSIGQALGLVIGNLRSGIQSIEEANLSQGQKQFDIAFENMNHLAKLLFERMIMSKDQMEGNASGMEFYLQQLQQMAGQQQQLNQSMPQLGMDGSPSSMMDQLAKMAARQQALRRSLKQIQQGLSEAQGDKRMTGNLDQIARDMEEVINRMRNNQVDRETIMRQEKIVQRLLDASRSATTRDYKKERESQTGSDLLRSNPLSLPGDLGDHESLINALRREVRNSDLTPEEKREMERYLESLLEQQQSPTGLQK